MTLLKVEDMGHNFSLGVARDQEQSPLGRPQQRECCRQSPVVLGSDPIGHVAPISDVERVGSGEQRGGVAIVAHTEEDQSRRQQGWSNHIRICGGRHMGISERVVGHHQGGTDLVHERPAGHAGVAVGVVGWYPALVAEPEHDAIPIQVQLGKKLIGGAWGAPPGETDGRGSQADLGGDEVGRRRSDGIRRVMDDHLHIRETSAPPAWRPRRYREPRLIGERLV